jgi:hypothetical protein
VFVDSEMEDPVPREAQTKGFEIDNGQYIIIDPDDVAAAIPESNKTLEIEAFIPCSDVDDVYFDKPYYLTPDKMGGDAFVARTYLQNGRNFDTPLGLTGANRRKHPCKTIPRPRPQYSRLKMNRHVCAIAPSTATSTRVSRIRSRRPILFR